MPDQRFCSQNKLNAIVRQSMVFKAVQMGPEFKWLLEKILLLEQRKTAVEIGVLSGGTFYAFIQLFDRAIGIDINEKTIPFSIRDQDEYIIGNSKDPEIISKFNDIDFLFIDGDHIYKGVSEDFDLWSPKVHRGGLIALHDINGANMGNSHNNDVKNFWNEIKGYYKTDETITQDKYYGIGLIYV